MDNSDTKRFKRSSLAELYATNSEESKTAEPTKENGNEISQYQNIVDVDRLRNNSSDLNLNGNGHFKNHKALEIEPEIVSSQISLVEFGGFTNASNITEVVKNSSNVNSEDDRDQNRINIKKEQKAMNSQLSPSEFDWFTNASNIIDVGNLLEDKSIDNDDAFNTKLINIVKNKGKAEKRSLYEELIDQLKTVQEDVLETYSGFTDANKVIVVNENSNNEISHIDNNLEISGFNNLLSQNSENSQEVGSAPKIDIYKILDEFDFEETEATLGEFGGFSSANIQNTGNNGNHDLPESAQQLTSQVIENNTQNNFLNRLFQDSNLEQDDNLLGDTSFNLSSGKVPELTHDFNTTFDSTFLSAEHNTSQPTELASQSPNKKDLFGRMNVLTSTQMSDPIQNGKDSQIKEVLSNDFTAEQFNMDSSKIVLNGNLNTANNYTNEIHSQLSLATSSQRCLYSHTLKNENNSKLGLILEILDNEALQLPLDNISSLTEFIENPAIEVSKSTILNFIDLSEVSTSTSGFEKLSKIYVCDIKTIEDAKKVQFRLPSGNKPWGLADVTRCFDGMQFIHVEKEDWIKNHYSHIVWNIFNLVRYFPKLIQADENYPEIVHKQLKVRYRNEVRDHMSLCLKSIVENQTSLQSNIIVFISEIIRGADFSGARPHFYISDGWYSIKCELDEPLRNSLLNNEFQLGQKIEITGAILQSSGSVPILESKDKLSLKLSSNGTRKACWSRKIGHQPYNWFIKEIKDIKLNGDIIPCTFGRIIRKHPFKIMIRSKSDGKSTIRTYEEELALKESTDMDESEDLTENEFTPFCALRIIDKNNTEAQITLWNISFETYNDFKEGENYCFYNLIPKRSKDRHKFNYHSVLQLNSTISTKCVNTKGSALNSHYNPALGKQLSTITSLESLEKGSNVDMCVLYLGKHLNGCAFIDQSKRILVIMNSSLRIDEANKLKPSHVYILENISVSHYHAKFDLQEADFNFHSYVSTNNFNQVQRNAFEILESYFNKYHYFIYKELGNKIEMIKQGTSLMIPLSQCNIMEGKFLKWEWNNDNSVIAEFQDRHNEQWSLLLDSAEWYQLCALSIGDEKVPKLIKDLNEGNFIDPKISSSANVKIYLELKKYSNTTQAFSLMTNILPLGDNETYDIKSILPNIKTKNNLKPLTSIYIHELKNIKAYFKKRVFKNRKFKLYVSPNLNSEYINCYKVEHVTLTGQPPLTWEALM